MSWDPGYVRDLTEHERRVLARAAAATEPTPGELLRVGGAVGAPGSAAIEMMRVTQRLSGSPLSLQCRRLTVVDGELEPTGDALEVSMFFIDAEGLGWNDVTPEIAVGSDIPVVSISPRGALYCLWPLVGTCRFGD